MANKKFYIFLFINFFLFKNYPGCLCRKKKPESNIYFKDGNYPTINLKFKNKIDKGDIYYDIFLYIEKEGKEHRDSYVFYYGNPNEDIDALIFCPDKDFLEILKDSGGLDKLPKDCAKYFIENKYLNLDLNGKDKDNLASQYYSNIMTYNDYYYYYFKDKDNRDRMYKKLLPDNPELYKNSLTETTFTIDKFEENEDIKEIKVSGKNIDDTSCDYRIATEFYIKSKKKILTVEFYRSKVQNTEYFTFSCEIFLNGKKIDEQKNIINSNDSAKNNTFTIDI